ncbi:hypothetical protein LINPERHAP2_LOCUS3679 [Linum perenne]|jgi:hypothetical protein
MVVGL